MATSPPWFSGQLGRGPCDDDDENSVHLMGRRAHEWSNKSGEEASKTGQAHGVAGILARGATRVFIDKGQAADERTVAWNATKRRAPRVPLRRTPPRRDPLLRLVLIVGATGCPRAEDDEKGASAFGGETSFIHRPLDVKATRAYRWLAPAKRLGHRRPRRNDVLSRARG